MMKLEKYQRVMLCRACNVSYMHFWDPDGHNVLRDVNHQLFAYAQQLGHGGRPVLTDLPKCPTCGTLLVPEDPLQPKTAPDVVSADDGVNHPTHYTHGGIEVIDAIEAWKLGFDLGNVVKYVARADHKGQRLQDLMKARWYLERAIKNAECSS